MPPEVGHANERKTDGVRVAVLIGDDDLEDSLGGTGELPLSGDGDPERGVDLGALDHALLEIREQLAVQEVAGGAGVDGHGEGWSWGGAVGDEGEADARRRCRRWQGCSR